MSSRSLRVVLMLLLLVPLMPGVIARAQSPSAAPVRQIPVTSIGFHLRLSPDGATAAVYDDGALLNYEVKADQLPIRLIDLVTGQQVAALDGFTDYAADVAFAPDGTTLASWHLNGELVLWDVSGATPTQTAKYRTGTLGNVQIAFLPDGTLVAMTPGIPTGFRLVETGTGTTTKYFGPSFDSYGQFLEANKPGPPFDYQYTTMAVSPDGTTVAAATFNDEVQLWTLANGEKRTVRPPSDQPGGLAIRQLTFTPGGEYLLYVDPADHKTHGWDMAANKPGPVIENDQTPFALSPDLSQLTWLERTDDDRTSVGLMDLGGSVAPFSLAALDGRPAPGISSVFYTPDGETIVVGGLFVPDGENAVYLVPSPG